MYVTQYMQDTVANMMKKREQNMNWINGPSKAKNINENEIYGDFCTDGFIDRSKVLLWILELNIYFN